MTETKRILITGACGQIGTELTMALRKKYGTENVLATDLKSPPCYNLCDAEPFEFLDVTNREALEEIVKRYRINTIYHLAALLSAVGEQKPQLCWDVNMNGLGNILEVARIREIDRIFCPSSIAVFGSKTPRDNTPQETILGPTTMYGVTKVSGELLCNYYARRFGVDVRGVRYPGIISSEALPGGGTTDYAVDIFYEAVANKRYTCFVRADTVLPMMYMPDAIRASMQIMEADASRLRHHANYNLASMSFSAGELAQEITKHIPELLVRFEPDYRQAIADSWPRSIDDGAAREEWGWEPEFDLETMTKDMLNKLEKRHAEGTLYSELISEQATA